jgi:arylsulfatase A-like enzyme
VGAHKDEPFFLLYTPYAPHFDATFFSVTPAPRHMGVHADLPPWRPASYREPDVDDKPRYLQRTQEAYWDELEASGEQDRLRIQQLESLLAVDEAVDALLDALEEAGLADDTLVVFTSDNGYMWGEHRLTGKNVAYEESIRVPLLIHHPLLVSAPRKETRLVTNLDLAPTILELADVEPTFPLDGRSLVDLLKGKEPVPPWRDAIVGDHWRIPQEGNAKPLFPHTRNFFLRSAKWKYIESRPFAVELYDLATDPLELENLAKDRAYLEQAISLRKRLNAAWSETEPDVEPTEPAD